MNKPIDRARAKSELERINERLREPHLLIGGLAVQQYYAARNSKDIDLVCNFDTAQEILKDLYPSRDWKVEDKHNDEYRPSYQISHKFDDDRGTIIFGPKISEREPYKHIDWSALRQGARPFKTATQSLGNILVPQAHALAYTKVISFLGRHGPENKIEADLQDFADLTNHENFSVSQFFDLLRHTKACKELMNEFISKCANYRPIIETSCLHDVSVMIAPTTASEFSKDSQLNAELIQSHPEAKSIAPSGGRADIVAWDTIISVLNLLHRKIEVEFQPDLVLTMSGPGSFAACYCMSINLRNVPVLVAATFPARTPMSRSAKEFSTFAVSAGWYRLDTAKWIVFLPNILDGTFRESKGDEPVSRPRKVLIFDDRVISGETQRAVSAFLTSRGFEVRRAAMFASPWLAKELHFIGSLRTGDYYLPWGPSHGRY